MAQLKDSVCIPVTMIVPLMAFAPDENYQRGQYQTHNKARHFDLTDGFIYFLHSFFLG